MLFICQIRIPHLADACAGNKLFADKIFILTIWILTYKKFRNFFGNKGCYIQMRIVYNLRDLNLKEGDLINGCN